MNRPTIIPLVLKFIFAYILLTIPILMFNHFLTSWKVPSNPSISRYGFQLLLSCRLYWRSFACYFFATRWKSWLTNLIDYFTTIFELWMLICWAQGWIFLRLGYKLSNNNTIIITLSFTSISNNTLFSLTCHYVATSLWKQIWGWFKGWRIILSKSFTCLIFTSIWIIQRTL